MQNGEKDIRIYPEFPRIGVGIVVFRNKDVLLIQRGQEPNKGIWTVPGGLIHTGESVLDAAHRETFEECNITIELLKQIDYFEFIHKDNYQKVKYHYVVLEFLALYKSGQLKALSDANNAKWIKYNALDHYDLTDDTRKLIEKAVIEYKARIN